MIELTGWSHATIALDHGRWQTVRVEEESIEENEVVRIGPAVDDAVDLFERIPYVDHGGCPFGRARRHPYQSARGR